MSMNPLETAGRRLRLLIVDDDPQFRNLLSTLLRSDYLVSLAVNGKDAFEKASAHPPDLMMVDVQMPEWNGIETLGEFRRHPKLAQIPVMMITGDASRQTVMAALAAGADDYVVKSTMSKDELKQKLLTLSRKRKGPGSPTPAPAARPTPQTAVTPPPVARPAAPLATEPTAGEQNRAEMAEATWQTASVAVMEPAPRAQTVQELIDSWD